MKIYVLRGFAPDPSEQCICTFADVFVSEAEARAKLLEIKNDTEMLLEDCHSNGGLHIRQSSLLQLPQEQNRSI